MPVLDAGVCLTNRVAVAVRGLNADMMATLERFLRVGVSLQAMLSVRVADATTCADDVPQVGGYHRLLDDGVEFLPHFAFEPGTLYRARFDPPRDAAFDDCAPLALDVCLPVKSNPSPRVLAVFPSGDEMPENLLRFYVTFSESMRRGRADAEVRILAPDGRPASDVLYRAPAELWDWDLRRLTVLLDPGRLKRGVGPNRQLGPPLKAGHEYTLVIGAGMTDRVGQPLPEAFTKRFRTTPAVRRPIEVDEWLVFAPAASSGGPLELVFPGALDGGMLACGIRVAKGDGPWLNGRCDVGRDEKRWSFTPAHPWTPGDYRVVVSSELEDVCGNDLYGAFDRDMRHVSERTRTTPARSIPFHIP